MKLLFRDISGTAAAPPAARELYLFPKSPELRQRRDLAMLVVQQGLACLRQGAGPIEAMVVRADPTLDEMLAAALAGELLAGRPLPKGAEAFAQYAALAREGLTPGTVSLEISMQGIFKAIRSQAGSDLTVPENGERFAADWARMARLVLPAAVAGQDPFTTSPFAEGAEFARERAYLAKDLMVYRQDVLRGEQWIVEIPGGPPQGRGLLLRQPKSLLYKEWSRSETDSGVGQPYVFLAVAEEPGNWIFSTDPVQKLPIKSLAEALQKEETAKNPAHATNDPWFDGQPFGHTMVAAPRGRTNLADREVLAIVRGWSHAQPVVQRRFGWKAPAAVAAAVLLLGIGIRVSGILTPTPKPDDPGHRGDGDRLVAVEKPESDALRKLNSPSRGSGRPIAVDKAELQLPEGGKSYALLFATEQYDQHEDGKAWHELYNPKNDVTEIGKVLHDHYGFIVNTYLEKSADEISNILYDWNSPAKYGQHSELLIFFAGHGYFDRKEHGGYIVTKDSLYSAVDPVKRNHSCISLDDLSAKLNKFPCRHVFLVLDTCFGGTIDYGVAMNDTRGGDTAQIDADDYVDEKLMKRSRLFLASAGKEYASDGKPGTHSPFAQQLLDYLNEKSTNNGIVTAKMLDDKISWLKGERPKFGAMLGNEDGGDFVFRRTD